jgi:hypothetical protein
MSMVLANKKTEKISLRERSANASLVEKIHDKNFFLKVWFFISYGILERLEDRPTIYL